MNIKRYIDAKVRKEVRRRLVCDGLIDDLKKACDRGAEKLKVFATEYPSVAKIIRILLKISGTFNGIAAGTVVGANGIAYLAARSKRELDAAYEETARMYGTTPGILKVGMIVGTISHILMAIIKFKVANALTPDTNGKKDASPFRRRHKTARRKGLKKKVNDLDIRGFFFKKTPKDVLIWDFFYTALNPVVTDRLIEDIKAQKVNEKQVLAMIKKPLIHIIDKEMPEVSEYKGEEMVAVFKMIKQRIASAESIDSIASMCPRCGELQRLSNAFKQLHKDSFPIKLRSKKRDAQGFVEQFKNAVANAKKCSELGSYTFARQFPRWARVNEIVSKISGMAGLGVASTGALKLLLGDLKRESNQLVKEGAPNASKMKRLADTVLLIGLSVVNLRLSKSLKNAREQVERDIKKEKSQTVDFLKDAGVKGMKKGQHVKESIIMKRFSDAQRLNIRRYIDAAIKREIKRYARRRYRDGILGLENGIKGALSLLNKAKIKEEVRGGDFVTNASYINVDNLNKSSSLLSKAFNALKGGRPKESLNYIKMSEAPLLEVKNNSTMQGCRHECLRALSLVEGLKRANSWDKSDILKAQADLIRPRTVWDI